MEGERSSLVVAEMGSLNARRRARVARRMQRRSASRFRLRRWVLGAILGVAALPLTASAQRIQGRITGYEHLENPVWAEARDPQQRGYSFRELVPTVPAKFRKLFPHIPKEVCLAALSEEPQPASKPVLIRVGGGRTTPVTIVVPPGTKLIFQNTDPFPHRLYGVDVQSFGPSDSAKGAKREWTVPAAGSYEIRDELAPSLRMWVVAEPNVAAIAYPSMQGEFRLNMTQPGSYKVQAYFAGKPVGEALPAVVAARDVGLKPIVVATPKKESKKEQAE